MCVFLNPLLTRSSLTQCPKGQFPETGPVAERKFPRQALVKEPKFWTGTGDGPVPGQAW